jgi:hypothetical protein
MACARAGRQKYPLTVLTVQALTAPGKDTGYSRNGSDPPAPLSRLTWYKGAETSVEPDAANPIQDDDCRLVLIYDLEHSDT